MLTHQPGWVGESKSSGISFTNGNLLSHCTREGSRSEVLIQEKRPSIHLRKKILAWVSPWPVQGRIFPCTAE